MALAGLDVGTSGCKMVVFDTQGSILCSASRTYKEYGRDGIREIDPQEVAENVIATISEAAALSTEPIDAIAIASIGESVVCLDESGHSLYRSMVTGDKRGIKEVRELVNLFGDQQIMDITGLPPSEMYALPKLMWMNKFTDVIPKARYIFFYEDYIGYLLTGKRVVSYSMASRSMAFDIKKKVWSQLLLDSVNINADKLSAPMPSGTPIGNITREMAEELNLPANAVIAVGGHDQNCAALGGGVLNSGTGEDGLGTCEVMVAMLSGRADKKIMLQNELPCVPYVLDNSYLTFVEITTSGVLMNWCRDTIMAGMKKECAEQGKDFFGYMDEQAYDADTTDLLVLPQFGSSGNPNVNYEAKGIIWGLTIHTDLFQIYRAVKEGMAFQMLLAYESLEQIGIDMEQIALTGGGSSSELTMQLRADIFGKEILMLENKEAGALGCAILAGTAIGRFDSIEQGVKKTVRVKRVFSPDPVRHGKYQIQYQQYKRLYEKIYNFK